MFNTNKVTCTAYTINDNTATTCKTLFSQQFYSSVALVMRQTSDHLQRAWDRNGAIVDFHDSYMPAEGTAVPKLQDDAVIKERCGGRTARVGVVLLVQNPS
jgi:hypothetical protein